MPLSFQIGDWLKTFRKETKLINKFLTKGFTFQANDANLTEIMLV